MGDRVLNIGYGHVVVASRVVAILSPGSSPMKRLRDEAKKTSRLIDATQGKKTRSIVVTDSNHVILSAFMADTIAHRFVSGKAMADGQPVQTERTRGQALADSRIGKTERARGQAQKGTTDEGE